MASISDFVNKEESEGVQSFEQQAEEMDAINQAPATRGFDLSFLKTQTGAGDISEYKNHALNFNGSNGVARILRGMTGFLGELNYAIVDVLLGVLEVAKDRKKVVAVYDASGAN